MKSIIRIIITCLLLFTINSNAQKITREYVNSVKVIPDDFGKENTTLVCIIRNHNGGKWIKKHIKKLYKGDYVFLEISGEQDYLKDDDFVNYSNKNNYRYFLDCIMDENLKYGTQVYVEDRKTGQRTPFMLQKSKANKLIEYLIMDLNDILSKN